MTFDSLDLFKSEHDAKLPVSVPGFILMNFNVMLVFFLSGTGDILRDMENQVEANSLRIKILEEQNSILRRSISKLLQAQKADSSSLSQMSMAGEPVPLWKVQQSTVTNGQHLESSSSPDSYLDAEPQK